MPTHLTYILKLIDSMPEPPKASLHALNLMENPDVSMARVAEFLSQDATLTAKLLKMSNSAYYGFQGRVKTVNEALTRIGLNLAKSTLLLSMVNYSGIRPTPFFQELWTSALYTAFLSKEMALKLDIPEVNLCFTGGLLCDIGQIFINEGDSSLYSGIARSAREHELAIHIAEQHQYGFNHTKIGVHVTEAWSLPPIYSTLIKYHHDPMSAHDKVLPNEFKMIVAVHVANSLTPLLTQMTGKDVQGDALRKTGCLFPVEIIVNTLLMKMEPIQRDVESIVAMMFE